MPSDTPFSELAQVNPPRPALDLRDLDPVSFIPMGNVSESGRWTEQQSRPYGEVRRGYTYCAEGDVLFAKITPCTENGKGCHAIGLTNGVGFASTEFHVLRAKEGVDPRYIFQWSVSLPLRLNAAAHMTGSAGQQRVPADFFGRFTVPKLPLPEQSKIAEVLSTVDRAIEQTEALIAKHQRIKTGLLQDLLTRGIDEHGNLRSEQFHEFNDSPLGRIPVEWDLTLLDSLAVRGSGHTPNKQRPAYWNGGIKWVSLADSRKLDDLYISETDKEISELGLKNSSAVLHPAGTVILSRDAGVGKSAILAHEMAVSQHFMAWRCKPTKLDNIYLYYWLQRDKPKFEGIASGSTIVTIGLQFFRAYSIAAPREVDEQIAISTKLKNADSAIAQTTLHSRKLRRLKTALMQDLLTGNRRVTALLEQGEGATA